MIQDITTIASKLLEISDSFNKARLEERAKIAKYFYRVAECLREVAKELQAGNEPHDKVGELKVLAEKLPDVIGQEVAQDRANEISQLLRRAIGNNLENLDNNEEVIRQIQGCAGEFDALAFTVDFPSSKSSTSSQSAFAKRLLVVLGIVGLVGVSSWFVVKKYFFAPDWLADGKVIELQTQSQSSWLDGQTASRTVGLAPSTGTSFTGTQWKVYVDDGWNRIIHLETQGETPGPRWLDGHTAFGTVGLAPSTGTGFTGTRWKVHVVSRKDRIIRLETQGETPGPQWLDVNTADRTVKLVESPEDNPAGTQWKVDVVNPDN